MDRKKSIEKLIEGLTALREVKEEIGTLTTLEIVRLNTIIDKLDSLIWSIKP